MPALSIVIPTLVRTGSIRAVLGQLTRQDHPLDEVEVLVALDAQAPRSWSISETDVGGLTVSILRAKRDGASAARNTGWRAASSPLVLFLDDDIVPVPSLVSEHVNWHQRHPEPEIGVLGLVKWSPQVRVTPFMRWLEMGIQFDYGRIGGTAVGWQQFYSCNVSVKREMLEWADGFDEQRFPYGYEDLELARRLSERGFELLFNPAALGEHLKTETLEGWRRNLRRIARAERRFTQLYPEERPYFHELFQSAASAPPARGRAAKLARYLNPSVPWLGPRVWRSYDMVCRQQLAPEFLREWDAAPAA